MNQDNAVAEALADELQELAERSGLYGGPTDPEAATDLRAQLVWNLPTIIAALKAQRVDEGGVS